LTRCRERLQPHLADPDSRMAVDAAAALTSYRSSATRAADNRCSSSCSIVSSYSSLSPGIACRKKYAGVQQTPRRSGVDAIENIAQMLKAIAQVRPLAASSPDQSAEKPRSPMHPVEAFAIRATPRFSPLTIWPRMDDRSVIPAARIARPSMPSPRSISSKGSHPGWRVDSSTRCATGFVIPVSSRPFETPSLCSSVMARVPLVLFL